MYHIFFGQRQFDTGAEKGKTMSDFSFLLSDKNVTLLDRRETICDNPDHAHHGKVESIAVDIGGHRFDITQDGKTYNIMADQNDYSIATERTRLQVLEYIDDFFA